MDQLPIDNWHVPASQVYPYLHSIRGYEFLNPLRPGLHTLVHCIPPNPDQQLAGIWMMIPIITLSWTLTESNLVLMPQPDKVKTRTLSDVK
jgi:hypothetical protein